MKKLLLPFLFYLELSALVTAVAFYHLYLVTVEPVHWFVLCKDPLNEFFLFFTSQIFFILITVFLYRYQKKELLDSIALGALPLLPLFGLLFLPLDYTSICIFMILTVFTVYRIVKRCGISLPELQEHGRLMAWLSAAGGLAGAVYGMYLQFHGVYHLSLIFSDWSIYVLAYQEMASSWFSAPLKFLTAGGHFNLLPNLVGALLFTVTSEPFAVFVLNSLVIYSTVPCTYFAARSSGVAPLHALIFSLGLLFHFSLANLNTCTFYGYHPNVYLLPLFLLFWGFFVQKKYRKAAVFAVLTLLVQETFAVLWFGFGLVLLLFHPKKLRILGAALIVGMSVWFFLITRFVVQWGFAEKAQYQQMFHYSNLGGSIPEILLSPFLRTEVFFRELLAVENLYFTLFLLIGFCAALFYSRLLVMLLPPLIGVFLLNNTELSNVAMQYQVEFVAVLAAAAAMGLKVCEKRSQADLTGALTAMFFAMVLCGIFAGRFPWSTYTGLDAEKTSCRERIARIKKIVPPGAKLQTTLRYQAHFIGRNTLLDLNNQTAITEAEYVLLPRKDFFLDSDTGRKLARSLTPPKWKKASLDPADDQVLLMIRVKP